MERKKFKRITRPTRLTPEEVARDKALCQKITAEFPPAEPRPPEGGAISDALRSAIKATFPKLAGEKTRD